MQNELSIIFAIVVAVAAIFYFFNNGKKNEKIVTKVPIVLIGLGESVAERAGLVVLQAIEQLEIPLEPCAKCTWLHRMKMDVIYALLSLVG